jgi:hypothetical protein
MSTFNIRPAVPGNSPALIGLTGPSGSGKTLSGLRLAHGIQSVTGGDICVIDTEARRALRYADKAKFPAFNFNHLEFGPPFSSDRYAEAIRAVYEAGNKTIMIDSFSHEHESTGGYLEFHEAELDRMAGTDYKKREKMTFTAWIKPAAARRRLINSFLQIPANFIFCFRAKEKLKIVGGGAPIPLGWQAIAGEEFVYEMIARCLLPSGCKGVPDWSDAAFEHGAAKRDDQDRALFPDGAQLSEEIGRNVALAVNGKPIERATRQQDAPLENLDALKAEGKEAAEGGVDVLVSWWKRLNAKQQSALATYKDETLKPMAVEADKGEVI